MSVNHGGLGLRGRLAITGVLLALPAMAAVVGARHHYLWRSAQGTLLDVARERVAESGRAICEGQAREWPPSPGEMSSRHGSAGFGRLIAYDGDGRPLDGVGPPLLPEIAAAASEGRDGIVAHGDFGGRPVLQALLRPPWHGARCQSLVFVRPRPAELPHETLPLAPFTGALVVVGLFLTALGPVVRRIRRLTLGVRRSAAGAYLEAVAVEGRDEIAELATAFNGAAAEVRKRAEAQEHREHVLRDFLANTTHDVAIPLTVLQGRLASMRRAFAAGAPLDDAVLTHAIEDAHYLGALIHNLGAAAKLEAGQAEISRLPVDLDGVVDRCVARHKPLADLLGVDLQVAHPESPLSTIGDVTLLEQAVGNAIHNAIHYNSRGGHVAVVLDDVGSRRFRITIADDGPGLGDAPPDRMLERGLRGDGARTRRPDGRGLGLDIAKRIADVHGMTLTPERPREGGLRMVFEGEIATTRAEVNATASVSPAPR